MTVRIGANPICWSNDDMQSLGDDQNKENTVRCEVGHLSPYVFAQIDAYSRVIKPEFFPLAAVIEKQRAAAGYTYKNLFKVGVGVPAAYSLAFRPEDIINSFDVKRDIDILLKGYQ